MFAQLRLDGSVEVGLPDQTTAIFPLERLAKLYDGMDQLDDMFDDDLSMHSSHEDDHDIQVMDENGQWADVDEEEDGWEDDMDVDSVEASNDEVVESTPGSPPSSSFTEPDHPPTLPETVLNAPSQASSQIPLSDDDSASWTRFEVLSGAPVDHAFYSTTPGQPSRQFMSRLSKEYRVLSSSLPGAYSIYQSTQP
jgi:ubiquitin-conjugating enzyme E2 O